MKYDVKTLEDGSIDLMLGNKGVTFTKDAPLEAIVLGIDNLVEQVVGVPVFKMVEAVLNAQQE